MIIMNIKGGIGNQLFQYSLGRKLSILRECELKFDTSSFENYIFPHKFRLNKFNINCKIANDDEINEIKKPGRKSDFNKKLMYNFGLLSKIYRMFYWRYDKLVYYKRKVILEKTFSYDPNILKIKDNCYLDGYCGNFKYFEDIRNILLQDFEIKKENETDQHKILKNEIKARDNTVSIHIRRGYVKREIDLEIFGVLPINYYDKAINYINEKSNENYYYIFSDDIVWAKKNLKVNGNHKFINFGSDGDFLELKLMSLCKHNIIANSTFSWWGAWLNENLNKIVIAPKIWYKKENYQKSYKKGYFVPQTWVKL